jgi:beta-glucosidase-like glycosyl hydrolase
LPTTLSVRAVRDVLRGEMGFDGVVLSDAMNMGAGAMPGSGSSSRPSPGSSM